MEVNMEALFTDIINMAGIQGILVLSIEGEIQFKHTKSNLKNPEEKEWGFFIEMMKGIKEAEFIFKKARIYFRRAESYCLLIMIDHLALMPMLRLNCDILLPSLQSGAKAKGIKGFFKR